MAHDDKAKEYPCVCCGKVFRRQLALERHVDVHHSSRSVSHKCEVCGKTFGSRNTLTMHRTIHGTQSTFRTNNPSTPPSGSSSPKFDDSLGHEDPLESEAGATASESLLESGDTIQTDVETSSEKDEEMDLCAEDDEIVRTRCRMLETENENPDTTTIPRGRSVTDESDFVKVSERVVTAVSGRRSAMTLSNVHLPAEHRSSDPCSGQSDPAVVGSVLDLFNGQSFSSADLMSNECVQQSMEFAEMLVEEIVSDSLYQPTDHLSTLDSNLEWSQSDRCLVEAAMRNASAGIKVEPEYDEPNDSRTKRQPAVDSSQRRTNKVRPEGAKKNHEKMRQSRVSEEADAEMVEDLESASTPKESASGSRQLNSNRTPFVCGLCHKSFDSEKYLSMHMPLHKPYVETAETMVSSSSGPEAEVQLLQGLPGAGKQKKVVTSEMQQWTCQYCNKSFMQNSNYKNHMRTHSDERPFVCETCNIGFKERYHLKKHVLFKHTTDLKETCRVCGKCFKDSTAVRAHERIHSELRPYSCNLCGKTFKTSECLWHHENRSKTCGKSALRRNDAIAVAAAASLTHQNEPGSTRRVRKPRQSPAGGTKTKSPRQSQKTGGIGQNCNYISKPYSPVDEDEQLMQNEIEASVLSIKSEPYCDLFDPSLQTFLSNEQELKNILEIFDFDVHKDGSSTEETGSDLTDSDTGLAKESEDFGGLGGGAKCNGLECTKCAKKFSSTATFEKHMVMHNEERPYRCTLCDNGFKLKVHLKKHHLYRHSDEYPCECSICGKRFKDSSAVRLHERIHSSDRPFRCHCGKGFKTRENLWGHRNRGPCEKTQDFITNNIRLFRSAEFGPILGVPISSGPSSLPLNPSGNCSLVDSGGRTINNNGQLQTQQSVQAVLLKTTQGNVTSTPHSVQFVPSCVISTPGFSPGQTSRQVKVATLRLIKPRACDTATYPTSILPTAIVTPIKREGAVQSSSTPNQTNHQQNCETTTKTVDSNISLTKHVPTKPQGNTSPNCSPDSSASTHTTANISPTPAASPAADSFFKTVADLAAGIRSQSSVAEKCPTVQKYLERSSTASIRFLEMNSLVGTTTVCGSRSENGHDQQKLDSKPTVTFKRQKLNSIGEDNSSTEGEDKNGRIQKQLDINCVSEGFSFADQESQESGSLPILDPLLPNSPFPASCTSMYPDIEDYGDMKYDPNDPTLNIGDMYWGDCDNTLSSGWILENESLFSDLSLTSNFGIL